MILNFSFISVMLFSVCVHVLPAWGACNYSVDLSEVEEDSTLVCIQRTPGDLREGALFAAKKAERILGVAPFLKAIEGKSSDGGQSMTWTFYPQGGKKCSMIARISNDGALEQLQYKSGAQECVLTAVQSRRLLDIYLRREEEQVRANLNLCQGEDSLCASLRLENECFRDVVDTTVVKNAQPQHAIGVHKKLRYMFWNMHLPSVGPHGPIAARVSYDLKNQFCFLDFFCDTYCKRYTLSHDNTMLHTGFYPIWSRLTQYVPFYQKGSLTCLQPGVGPELIVVPKSVGTNVELPIAEFLLWNESAYDLFLLMVGKDACDDAILTLSDDRMECTQRIFEEKHQYRDHGSIQWCIKKNEVGQQLCQCVWRQKVLTIGSSPVCSKKSTVSIYLAPFGHNFAYGCMVPLYNNLVQVRSGLNDSGLPLCPTASGCVRLGLQCENGCRLALQCRLDGRFFRLRLPKIYPNGDEQRFHIFNVELPQFASGRCKCLCYEMDGPDTTLHFESALGSPCGNPLRVHSVGVERVLVFLNWLPHFAADCQVSLSFKTPLIIQKKLLRDLGDRSVVIFSRSEIGMGVRDERVCEYRMSLFFNKGETAIACGAHKTCVFEIDKGFQAREAVNSWVRQESDSYYLYFEYSRGLFMHKIARAARSVSLRVTGYNVLNVCMEVKDHEGLIDALILEPCSDYKDFQILDSSRRLIRAVYAHVCTGVPRIYRSPKRAWGGQHRECAMRALKDKQASGEPRGGGAEGSFYSTVWWPMVFDAACIASPYY